MPDLDDPHGLGGSRWRLGVLTLLAITVVVGGLAIFGCDSDTADPPGSAAPGITIPPLPTTVPDDDAAPDFSVELFGGEHFSLAGHLADDGRPVILNLWASWCPPCRQEMPDLDAAALAHPEILFLGIAVDDDPVAAEGFADEIEISYPAGYDETGRIAAAYASLGLPTTFVISGDGRVLHTAVGRLTAGRIDELVAIAVEG